MNFNLLKRKNLIIIIVLACVFLVKIFFLSKLNGLGWEPDEYMHFLEAKTLFTNFPQNLGIGLGVWSKPGYIYIYGLIITIFNISSLFAAQIITVLIGLLTSWFILKILDELKCSFKIQILGLVLTNFSFLMFRGSLSIMTEPIFALFLTTGIYFLLRKKMNLTALMFGLLPLIRIEGLLFVIAAVTIILLNKLKWKHFVASSFEFRALVLLLIPTFIWNLLGFIMTGKLLYIIDNGYPLEAGKYSHGGWPYYIEGFLKIDPIIFILFVISAVYIYRYFKDKQWVKFGIISSFLLFLALQIIFWKFGLFGTAGLMRYFITVMPLAIIPIALFFEHMFKTIHENLEKKLIVIAICCLQIFFTLFVFIRGDLVFNQETRGEVQQGILEAGQWVKDYVSADTKVYSDIPEVIYFANRDLNNSTIFGIDQAYAKREKAVYVFKLSTSRDVTFYSSLKGSGVVNFANNVYVVTL